MNIWIDAQLPPNLANWTSSNFDTTAVSLKQLSLRDAKDTEIFEAAKFANAIIMTKDSDFIDLVCSLGSPLKSSGLLAVMSLIVTYGNFSPRRYHQL